MRFDCRTYTCSVENVDVEILVSTESFAQNKCADHQKPFHTHVYYELLLSQSDGGGEVVCRNARIPLHASGVAIVAPSCSHRTVIHDPESLISLGFLFKKRRACSEKTLNLYSYVLSMLDGTECFYTALPTHLACIGVELKSLALDKTPLGNADFCAAFLRLLFGALKSAEQNHAHTVCKNHTCSTTESGRRLPVELASKINSVLANEFTTDITPDTLSKQYFISVKQINRYVYSQYGMTFLQRRNELRMICAARLLLESADTVADIARQVGYASVNSFYSAFQKRFDKTPTEYRNGMLTGTPE